MNFLKNLFVVVSGLILGYALFALLAGLVYFAVLVITGGEIA